MMVQALILLLFLKTIVPNKETVLHLVDAFEDSMYIEEIQSNAQDASCDETLQNLGGKDSEENPNSSSDKECGDETLKQSTENDLQASQGILIQNMEVKSYQQNEQDENSKFTPHYMNDYIVAGRLGEVDTQVAVKSLTCEGNLKIDGEDTSKNDCAFLLDRVPNKLMNNSSGKPSQEQNKQHNCHHNAQQSRVFYDGNSVRRERSGTIPDNLIKQEEISYKSEDDSTTDLDEQLSFVGLNCSGEKHPTPQYPTLNKSVNTSNKPSFNSTESQPVIHGCNTLNKTKQNEEISLEVLAPHACLPLRSTDNDFDDTVLPRTIFDSCPNNTSDCSTTCLHLSTTPSSGNSHQFSKNSLEQSHDDQHETKDIISSSTEPSQLNQYQQCWEQELLNMETLLSFSNKKQKNNCLDTITPSNRDDSQILEEDQKQKQLKDQSQLPFEYDFVSNHAVQAKTGTASDQSKLDDLSKLLKPISWEHIAPRTPCNNRNRSQGQVPLRCDQPRKVARQQLTTYCNDASCISSHHMKRKHLNGRAWNKQHLHDLAIESEQSTISQGNRLRCQQQQKKRQTQLKEHNFALNFHQNKDRKQSIWSSSPSMLPKAQLQSQTPPADMYSTLRDGSYTSPLDTSLSNTSSTQQGGLDGFVTTDLLDVLAGTLENNNDLIVSDGIYCYRAARGQQNADDKFFFKGRDDNENPDLYGTDDEQLALVEPLHNSILARDLEQEDHLDAISSRMHHQTFPCYPQMLRHLSLQKVDPCNSKHFTNSEYHQTPHTHTSTDLPKRASKAPKSSKDNTITTEFCTSFEGHQHGLHCPILINLSNHSSKHKKENICDSTANIDNNLNDAESNQNENEQSYLNSNFSSSSLCADRSHIVRDLIRSFPTTLVATEGDHVFHDHKARDESDKSLAGSTNDQASNLNIVASRHDSPAGKAIVMNHFGEQNESTVCQTTVHHQLQSSYRNLRVQDNSDEMTVPRKRAVTGPCRTPRPAIQQAATTNDDEDSEFHGSNDSIRSYDGCVTAGNLELTTGFHVDFPSESPINLLHFPHSNIFDGNPSSDAFKEKEKHDASISNSCAPILSKGSDSDKVCQWLQFYQFNKHIDAFRNFTGMYTTIKIYKQPITGEIYI